MGISIVKCNTISSLITYSKSLDISHDKIHFKTSLTNSDGDTIVVNTLSLIDKYIDFLQPSIVDVVLSDSEYSKYIYQPKTLCFDMYGTTELWSSVLRINNLTSASEFNIKSLKLFNKKIFDLLNEILILEKTALTTNRHENGL